MKKKKEKFLGIRKIPSFIQLQYLTSNQADEIKSIDDAVQYILLQSEGMY